MHFLREMFVLSYVNELLDSDFFKSVLPRIQNRMIRAQQTSMFYSHIVLLIYVNETIYVLGNLPFFMIQVNRLMARDDSPGANVTSKCGLRVRGLVPLSEF